MNKSFTAEFKNNILI